MTEFLLVLVMLGYLASLLAVVLGAVAAWPGAPHRRHVTWPPASPPAAPPPKAKPATYRDDARGGDPCPTCGRRG